VAPSLFGNRLCHIEKFSFGENAQLEGAVSEQGRERDRGNLAARVYDKVLFIANGISITRIL